MVGPDDPIIPLIRESAPLIERIRERRQSNDNVANELGELAGRVVKSDSQTEKDQTHQDLVEGITESLAKELGVSDEDINTETIEGIADSIVSLTEADVLTQDTIDQLDINLEGLEEVNDIRDDEQQQEEVNESEVSGGSEETEEAEGHEEATETDLFDSGEQSE